MLTSLAKQYRADRSSVLKYFEFRAVEVEHDDLSAIEKLFQSVQTLEVIILGPTFRRLPELSSLENSAGSLKRLEIYTGKVLEDASYSVADMVYLVANYHHMTHLTLNFGSLVEVFASLEPYQSSPPPALRDSQTCLVSQRTRKHLLHPSDTTCRLQLQNIQLLYSSEFLVLGRIP